jgi:hypothetical protein
MTRPANKAKSGAAAAIIAGVVTAGPAWAGSAGFNDWATIKNARFGFQIAYPAEILFPIDTPSGGDGRVLQSKDGAAKLLVATFENAEKLSLDDYRQFLLSDIYANAKIDYQPLRDRWFVLSGVRGNETFYERVTFSCGGKLINSWAMVYPTAKKKLYDRVVEAVARTYTAGAGVDGNCKIDETVEKSAGGPADNPDSGPGDGGGPASPRKRQR